MKTQARQYPTNLGIGCYVDESAGSADDCNERTIKLAESYGFDINEPLPDEDNPDRSEILSEIADSALDFLNEKETRSFVSWQFEDNSLFLMPDVESAKEDCGFVSVKSLTDAARMGIETDPEDSCYPPADYSGEWLHVSDHGNATLYIRENGVDKEIWSVV